MKTLLVCTNNAHKLVEIQTIFPQFNVRSYGDVLGKIVDVVEDGKTFEENAIKKVEAMPSSPHFIYLADDSGLEVDAFDGEPGIYSARYGGDGLSSLDQCQLILDRFKSHQPRTAQFTCVMALRFPDGSLKTVTGIIRGTIAHSIQGNHGFGYDPIFIPDGYSETFAQLGAGIKNKLSHRNEALKKLAVYL